MHSGVPIPRSSTAIPTAIVSAEDPSSGASTENGRVPGTDGVRSPSIMTSRVKRSRSSRLPSRDTTRNPPTTASTIMVDPAMSRPLPADDDVTGTPGGVWMLRACPS